MNWQRGPHRGQSPLPQGFVARPESRRRRGSPVGAGSTRDGGSMLTAESGICSARKVPIAGRARSHRDLWCGLNRVPPRISCGSGFYPRWRQHAHRRIWNMQCPKGPHRGQSPLPQGSVVRPESRRRRGSPVGAGSTRDGGGQVAAGSGMCIGRKGPIAGRARSHREFGWGLDRVGAVDLLWERVLPAMAAACSPQNPACAAPERSPSRAEPAPTGDLWCGLNRVAAADLLWERVLPAMAAACSPQDLEYAAPERSPIAGRARSHRDLWCGLNRVAAADLLWERVLPAMTAACSPQNPACAVPERSPSRAEPAPTEGCGAA